MARNYFNKAADEWYENIKEELCVFPFSFVYDGIKYKGFGSDFVKKGKKSRQRMAKRLPIYSLNSKENLP